NLEVVGQSQWRLQLCAQLGISSLKADGIRLSQRAFDGRERRVRLPNQSKCSSLLEVRFELFSDTAKPVQARSSDREIRQGLAGLTHLPKHDRVLQERLCVDDRINLRARREHFIELRFR